LMYARLEGEEGVHMPEVMLEKMTVEERIRTACKVLGMALIGASLGLLMVLFKWYTGVELR